MKESGERNLPGNMNMKAPANAPKYPITIVILGMNNAISRESMNHTVTIITRRFFSMSTIV